jgi:ketosteroid isomerase-like protein
MRKLIYFAGAIVLLLGITAGALHLRAQTNSAADDKAAIQALYTDFNNAFMKKDVDKIMSFYAPNIFAFDAVPPREYPTFDAYKKDFAGLFTTFPGPITSTINEVNITVVGSVAYTHAIDDGMFTLANGTKAHLVVRFTDVLRKSAGKWLIVQEYVSFPVDPTTGKADLLSTR